MLYLIKISFVYKGQCIRHCTVLSTCSLAVWETLMNGTVNCTLGTSLDVYVPFERNSNFTTYCKWDCEFNEKII